MSIQVGDVQVTARLDSSSLKSSLASTRGDVESWASGLERRIGGIGSAIGGALKAGIMVGGAALVAGATLGLKSFSDFEQGAADLNKIMGGTAQVQKTVADGMRQMSIDSGTAVTELLSVAASLSALGVDSKDLVPATKVIDEMGIALGISNDQAASYMAGMKTLYGTSVDQWSRLASGINEVENSTSATSSGMLNFANSFAPVAKMFGVTDKQALALGATFEALKIAPEEAATSIKSAINFAMQDPKRMTSWASMLGTDVANLEKMMDEDLSGTLLKTGAELGKIQSGTERSKTTFETFGAYGEKSIALLGDQLGSYNSNLDTLNRGYEENISLTKEVATRNNTLLGSWNKAKAAINDLGIDIGKVESGPVRKLLDSFTASYPKIKDFTSAILGGDWGKAESMLSGFANSAIKYVSGIDFGGVANKVIGGITAGLRKIDYSRLGEGLKDALVGAWDWASNSLSNSDVDLAAPFKAMADVVGPTLKSVWGTLSEAAIPAINAVGEAVTTLVNFVGESVTASVRVAIMAFATLAGSASMVIQEAKSWIGLGGTQSDVGSAGSTSPQKAVKGKTYISDAGFQMYGEDVAAYKQRNPKAIVKPMAHGGFIANSPVLMAEAGEEAFVPISDRAAGLAILPEVARRLGIRTMAKGGISGSDQWIMDTFSDKNLYSDPLQTVEDALWTVSVAKSGAVGIDANRKAAEEAKASGEKLTGIQESSISADNTLKSVDTKIESVKTDIHDMATKEFELTNDPLYNKIAGYANALTWDRLEFNKIKTPAEEEAAKQQTKAAQAQIQVAEATNSKWQSVDQWFSSAEPITVKTASNSPIAVTSNQASPLTVTTSYRDYNIPGLLPYTEPMDKNSFRYQTGMKYMEDYQYNVIPPNSFRWGGNGFGGRVPSAASIAVSGNIPTAWLSEGQPNGMDMLSPMLRQMQLDYYPYGSKFDTNNIYPWFAREPTAQPSWWTQAASKLSPGYSSSWSQEKGDPAYYQKLIETAKGFDVTNTRPLTSEDVYNAIYDQDGVCVGWAPHDPSLKFTPGRDYLPGGKWASGMASQAIYSDPSLEKTAKATEETAKNTAKSMTRDDFKNALIGAGTYSRGPAIIGGEGAGGTKDALSMSNAVDSLTAETAWAAIYDNGGTCIGFVPAPKELTFTPGKDYLPGGKGLGNMGKFQSLGDQETSGWDPVAKELVAQQSKLEQIQDSTKGTEKNTDKMSKDMSTVSQNSNTAMAAYAAGGGGVGVGWGMRGGMGGSYGTFFDWGYGSGPASVGVSYAGEYQPTGWSEFPSWAYQAEGGIVDQPFAIFGEAGREAFVPIADRAAGLRILPRVMKELGVRTFASGGFTGKISGSSALAGLNLGGITVINNSKHPINEKKLADAIIAKAEQKFMRAQKTSGRR